MKCILDKNVKLKIEKKFGKGLINTLDILNKGVVPKIAIYGGAVRDALAGLPIKGDLDICIRWDFVENMRQYLKWGEYTENAKNYATGKYAWEPIHNPLTYTKGKNQIQLIIPRTNCRIVKNYIGYVQNEMMRDFSLTPHQDQHVLLFPVTHVDLVCCGVFMYPCGTVWEAVPGAYSDCKNRILRRNTIPNVHSTNTDKRIKKLIKRGWRTI